ncbi:response regulator [Ideonella sp. A 288]|uniref:response regulator n=1 Tax=Ideonella sp. A 288 TaxID=1962181 RepID=UPI000B4B5A7E|nr:response regulator [Ideonella sp. A 288]
MTVSPAPQDAPEHFTTLEVARMLGMAVRSVQMMVDRGDLEAWKTPGGHRRISRQSVERWLVERQVDRGGNGTRPSGPAPALPNVVDIAARTRMRVLVIEDSVHYQNLLSIMLRKHLPDADVQLADDGIAGLAMAGRLDPDVLIVDILLPGIDGATLITSLRSHPQFSHSHLIVVTALDEAQRAPYAFALGGVPVVHKTQIVRDLPPLLQACTRSKPGNGKAL